MTPKPVTPFALGKRGNGAFTGDAPWALSALPECFVQESRTTGPLPFVMAHLPKGAMRVLPGRTVTAADCSVFVKGDEVWVWRGKDRLRVPPPSQLYASGNLGAGGTLALLQGGGRGFDLRVYSAAATEQQTQ